MTLWISRKLAPPEEDNDDNNDSLDHIYANPLIIVVAGTSNIGKSTFIRLGLQNLIPKHDSNRPDLQCHHTNIVLDQNNYPMDVIETNPDQLTMLTQPIHGGFVCYDETDDASMKSLPDLFAFFTSRFIPFYLVGLKSDLLPSRQLDPKFDAVKQYRVSAFSEDGPDQIHAIFMSLLEQDLLLPDDYPKEVKTRPNTWNSMNPMEDNAGEGLTAGHVGTTNVQRDHTGSTLLYMVNKNPAHSSYYTHLSSRRGSKDSSDSLNIGLTPDDIVDRLLFIENAKTDENMIPIFLTFFRKFMKPYELVKKLVERFEQDGLSTEVPPTDLQKRIHTIFSLWLSCYWNDFYGPHSRRHIILFLDRISKYENLTFICDSLAPLVVREPPLDDPDRAWGLVDDNNEILDYPIKVPLSPPPTPVSPSRKKKKDSGYVSGGGFSLYSQELNTQHEPFSLRRLSSSHYSPDKSPRNTTIHTMSPNLSRLFSRRKQVSHSESHPDLRSSYHKPLQEELPRRAEFAGGLINVDHVVRNNRYYSPPSMMTPSIATTQGHGWATSLGGQLFGSSIISSFRHHRSEKDQANDNYKLLIKTSEHVIADQLTWIEAELFARINPREFVRHIWDNTNNNNTVMASIAHFNFISAWLVTMIVTQSRLSKRVALLQKFMLVAVELRNRNNYNSLMAILAGINSAAILRLKQTQQAISNKKVYKQFQSLERLMSTDRSFSCYRMALRASDAPGIPYLGIHNQDLVSLAEANKDFRQDGTVHWEKFRLMGETIMATMKLKNPGYDIEPDAKILTFIADCYILSEDEQYKRSTLVEPKAPSTGTSRIRDLWFSL